MDAPHLRRVHSINVGSNETYIAHGWKSRKHAVSGRRGSFDFLARVLGRRRPETGGSRDVESQETLMHRLASGEGVSEELRERVVRYNEIKRPIFEGANLLRGETVEQGIRLLESVNDQDLEKRDAALKHIQLGIAYAKKGDIDKSNFHYRNAVEYDHPTGWAYEKLVINLSSTLAIFGS